MSDNPYLISVSDGFRTRPSGQWAAEKLFYLRNYIDIFETSMRIKWPNRNFIDLFAGPGKNFINPSKEIQLGSPIIALTTRFPFTGYYFSDIDTRNTEALKIRCSASPHFDRVRIYTENANHIVSSVVGNIRQFSPNSLNLAFLDPEGLELEWPTVAEIGELKKCDLIIHYSQQGLSRYIGKAYDSDNETIVDRFFGTDEWRKVYALWHEKPNKKGMHRELINFYKEKLRSLGYIEVRQTDEILSEPLIRNRRRNAPLYRLIFASKNRLGEEFWQKITQRDIYGQKQLF